MVEIVYCQCGNVISCLLFDVISDSEKLMICLH